MCVCVQRNYVNGIAHQQIILRLLLSITAKTSYFFINKIWPEFAELLATRPITIHEFNSTEMEYLNKRFFWVNFKFILLCHKSTLNLCSPAV